MDPSCICTLEGPLVLHTLSEEKIESPDNTVSLMGQAIMLCWNFSVFSSLSGLQFSLGVSSFLFTHCLVLMHLMGMLSQFVNNIFCLLKVSEHHVLCCSNFIALLSFAFTLFSFDVFCFVFLCFVRFGYLFFLFAGMLSHMKYKYGVDVFLVLLQINVWGLCDRLVFFNLLQNDLK